MLLGVCGSVAAFKGAALASELTRAGATVRVILTASGARFVTAETFRDLTGQPVAVSLWDAGLDHIELARWADLIVVAPASANLLARAALGLADDLLATVLLASPAPVVLAPAMETGMWEHPATRATMQTLSSRGARFVGPVPGRLASGAEGSGRMAEPAEIVKVAGDVLATNRRSTDLAGLRVVVTAGPTREAIDPVRFLSNHSSGKMGYEIASAASNRGASVVLISGPVDDGLKHALPGVDRRDVTTAAEMTAAVLEAAATADVVIMAAAVADFRPAEVRDQKVKKSTGMPSIELTPTEDILVALQEVAPDCVRVGFAAETEHVMDNARNKLASKGVAMLVVNDVSPSQAPVFGADTNQVTILRPHQPEESLPRLPKRQVAERIVDAVAEIVAAATSSGPPSRGDGECP